jgi:hypothetical protein
MEAHGTGLCLGQIDGKIFHSSVGWMLVSHSAILGVQCLVKSRGIRNVRASFSRRFFCVLLTIMTPPVQHKRLTGLTTLRVLNSASLNWGHFVAERDGKPKV